MAPIRGHHLRQPSIAGFSIETLRYYERVGLLRDVPRDGAGHRAFTDEHLAWLKILRCLRDTGMPIAQMQRYVELAVHDGPIPARLELLEQHDDTVTRQIAELRRWQKHLREKIAGYQRQIAQAVDLGATPRFQSPTPAESV